MDVERDLQKSVVKQDFPVLLFDGVCNFCDNTVQFVLKRDTTKSIRFASLQSEFGQSVLNELQLPIEDLKSLIFLEKGKAYTRSTGALKLAPYLGILKIAYIFIIIPQPIRDWAYNIIAKNRYRWFGEKDECMIPSPEVRQRFLDW